MACLRLSLLGSFEAELDGEPVTGFATTKIQALLAYLAVESHRAHRREVLAALLWPDWPERAARTNLRNALSKLRTAIGDRQAGAGAGQPYLLITRETVQFNAASAHWLDVAAFRGLVALGDQAATDRGGDAACDRLQQAIAVYRGPFLEGFGVGDSRAFEDWAFLVRERLQRQVLAALQRLIGHCERRDEIARACEFAWRWVELAPWQEQAHRALMRCLALSGQRSAALAQYEACCRALKEELDVEPGEETVRLYERIRDGELAPAPQKAQAQTRAPPVGMPVVEWPPEVPSVVAPDPALAPATTAPAETPVAARKGLPGWVWGLIGAIGTLVLLIVAGAALLANQREGASPTAPLSPADEGQVYFNDFDGGPSVAPGVTATLEGVTTIEPVQGYDGVGGDGSTFGGDFLRNTTGGNVGSDGPIGTPGSPMRLTLTELPPHTRIEINFLLAIIDSWDGSESGEPGGCCDPDLLSVLVDGNIVFSEAFGFNSPVYDPPPGVLLVEYAPLGFNPDDDDCAYDMGHDPTFDGIPHTASTLTIEWFASGDGWQGGDDESWAIDNLEIVLHGGETTADIDLALTPAMPYGVEPKGGKYVDLCKDVTPPQICVRDDRTGQTTQVTSDLDFGQVGGPGWSPDGQQILFAAGSDPEVTGWYDHKLYVIQVKEPLPSTARSDLRQITSGNTTDLDPAWSPDGQWIAFHRNGGLWIVRPDGSGAEVLLAETGTLCANWPAWSPDSQQIAFSNTNAPFIELWVIDADGSDPHVVHTFERRLEWGSPGWSPDGKQMAGWYWDGDEEKSLLIYLDGSGQPQIVDQIPRWWFRNFWPQWGGK